MLVSGYRVFIDLTSGGIQIVQYRGSPDIAKKFRRDNIVCVQYPMQLEGKLIFPEVAKKFLPGKGQYALRPAADRVLADQDEILKYTFLF